MRLFYVDWDNCLKENQKLFNQDDTHGALCLSLSDAVELSNNWMQKYLNEKSSIVEVEVSNKDLVGGLNAAMVGNVHTIFNGEVIKIHKITYNLSNKRWQVII